MFYSSSKHFVYFFGHLYHFSTLQFTLLFNAPCALLFTRLKTLWWSIVMQDIFEISKTVAIVFRYNPSLIIDKLHLFCKSIRLSILSLASSCCKTQYLTYYFSLSLSLSLSLFFFIIWYISRMYDKNSWTLIINSIWNAW